MINEKEDAGMSVQRRQVVLSRFFDSNVQLVAKMCPRCYEDCVDVRIVAVSSSFLRQAAGNLRHVDMDMPDHVADTESYLNESEAGKDVLFGFSEEDISNSMTLGEKFLDTMENVSKKDVERSDSNNNTGKGSFVGFSPDEIVISRKDYQKFVEINKSVRHKIYRKLNSKVISNICNNKIRHRKTGRRKVMIAQCPEKVSRYFKCEKGVQENQSKYFSTIKEEKLDMKLEHCEHVKPDPNSEPVDHESQYFKVFERNQFNVKVEHSAVKKESFEGSVQEEKAKTIWIPPRSPHNLIEEVLYHDPWALLVATIFLNRTSCMCARPYIFWFLTENPNPLKVLEKFPEHLEKYFVKLGLQRTRAVQVWRMSHDFVHKDWVNVKELYGIGKYGENAYSMFCLGDFSVAPKDRFLRIYKAWYEKIVLNGEGGMEKEGFEDCVSSDSCAF